VSDIIHDRAIFNFNNMNSYDASGNQLCRVDQLRIKYREVGTSAWSQKNIGSPTGYNASGVCNSTQRTDKPAFNLTPSTTYEWQMKAWYCGQGPTAWVVGPNFTTADACPNVINFAATPLNNVKANFTWDTIASYSFVRIKLRVDTNNATWTNAGGMGVSYPALSKQKSGLSAGVSYRAQARTWCNPQGGAYKAASWTPLIFWTQPGGARLEAENTAITNLEVYPNPSRDIFNVSFVSDEVQNLEVSIINVVGEAVYTANLDQFVGQFTKEVSLATYPKGVYFLEITTNKGMVNKKLILQ
jgi:hypothetical protein